MSSTQNRTLVAVTGGGQRFIYGPFGVQEAAKWVPSSGTEGLGATHAGEGKWTPTGVWWALTDGRLDHSVACCPQPGTGVTQSIPGLASARRPLKSGPALSGQGDDLLDCGRLCWQQGNNLHQEAAAVSSGGSWAGV